MRSANGSNACAMLVRERQLSNACCEALGISPGWTREHPTRSLAMTNVVCLAEWSSILPPSLRSY